MAKKAKTIQLDTLNVWATCRIQVINFDTERYETIAEVPYTPRHIKAAMKKAKLESAYIWFMGGRTLQFISDIRAN